ncbi:hypothetical protein MKW92_009149 [Papaver armeniacum]|nr:hypothetical protein MKW92_009149 [Papaver armeniacum]
MILIRVLIIISIVKAMISTGFQASHLGEAIEIFNHMLEWRLSDEPLAEDCSEEEQKWSYREAVRCKVFLSFTSNIISSEEDLIKCLAPTYKGDFSLPGAYLRSKGQNRAGNLIVPNDNYCKFENWITPILDQMVDEQFAENVLWTPSKVIARLGKEINDPSSYLYWAYKDSISFQLGVGLLKMARLYSQGFIL